MDDATRTLKPRSTKLPWDEGDAAPPDEAAEQGSAPRGSRPRYEKIR